jgi:hypothetical protein
MGLSDHERRIVLAIGQTMFPRDAVLGIDADDANVVEWVDDYLARMPPFARGQIRALLNSFEYGYAAWAGRPRDTFSAARPADRALYLESWERSSSYVQRMLYEALRAMFTFAYVESDAVEEQIHPPQYAPSPPRAAGEG